MSSTNRSGLKEFLGSISTIKGDLSNITAPPFLLASQSTVQFPSYWAEYPEHFLASAKESDPVKRMVLVLKWFLICLKRQQYAGRDPKEGVKKPLNAFLGEVFVAECGQDDQKIRLLCEQVSHHPPITACCLWSDRHGIKAEGFACQEITFSGNVNIQQHGHAILRLNRFDEDYLVPLPNVKVSGLLGGTPYPELIGTNEIICSNGLVAEIDFSGKRMLGLGGQKNHVYAAVFDMRKDAKRMSPLYSVDGNWSDSFAFKDERSGSTSETWDTNANQPSEVRTLPLEEQDPWESRKAWKGTIDALESGQMQQAVDAKSKIEEGQRGMRRDEEKSRRTWEPIFFTKHAQDASFENLAKLAANPVERGDTGFWKSIPERVRNPRRPFHGVLEPTNTQATGHAEKAGVKESDGIAGGQLRGPMTKRERSEERSVLQDVSRHSASSPGAPAAERSARIGSSPYSIKPLDSRVDGPLRR